VGLFQPGDVVVAEFFFTDGKQTKIRPALVIASFSGDDYLICSITSVVRADDPFKIPLGKSDLIGGNLFVDSHIRPSLLMTVTEGLIHKKIGSLPDNIMKQVRETIVNIITGKV
jgi:mRNA interferase MazF